MAVRFVTVKYDVDDSELEESKTLITQISRELGITEDQVRDINKNFKAQTGILGDLRRGEAALLRARENAQSPERIREINQELSQTQREIRNLTGEYQRQEAPLARLGKLAVAAFSVAAIGTFIKKTVDLASSMETTRISFEQFTGSAAAAKDILGDIEDFAASTPFQFPELADTAKNLLAFGVAQERILPLLRQIGDVAAGTGNQVDELGAIYGKIVTKGKAQSEELLQLAERGVPIIQVLGEMYGKTGEEIFAMGSKGEITGEVIDAAFKKMTSEGGKFFELTQKQSETTSGRLSTLRDNFEKLARQIGDNLLPVVNKLASGLLAVFQLIGLDKKAVSFDELFAISEKGMEILEFLPRLQSHFKASDAEMKKFATTLEDFDFSTQSFDESVAELSKRFVAFRNGLTLADLEQKKVAKSTNATTAAIKAQTKAIKDRNKSEIAVPDSVKFDPKEGIPDDAETLAFLNEIAGQVESAGTVDIDGDIFNIRTDGIKDRLADAFDPEPVDKFAQRFGASADFIRTTIQDIQEGNIDIIDGIEDIIQAGIGGVVQAAQTAAQITQALIDISFNKQEAKLKEQQESELARFGNTEEQKAAINEKFAKKEEALRKKKAQQEKRLAIFETIINTAAAIVAALPNIPLSIIAGLTGAAQLAVIQSQSFKAGVIDLAGPGTGTSDSIPANLSRGESVMTAAETRAFKPALMAIRKGEISPMILNDFVRGKIGTFGGGAYINDNSKVVSAINGLKRQMKGLQIHNITLDENGFSRYISSQDSYKHHLQKMTHG